MLMLTFFRDTARFQCNFDKSPFSDKYFLKYDHGVYQ